MTGLGAIGSLDGKVALVTGGAGGIGSAAVARLAEAGARVICVDREGAPPVETAQCVACDLASPAAIDAMFDALGSSLDRLDVVVHCAGITRDAVLWKLDADAWSSVMRVNLDAAFHVLRRATPLLRERGGSVVLVSSINGERGKFGQSNYAASKAGLIGLARSAARELGRFDVRVNVVAPGLIATAMTRALPEEVRRRAVDETVLGRAGEPDDVARAIWFLASPASRHITGQVLRVDGGQLIG